MGEMLGSNYKRCKDCYCNRGCSKN